MKKNDELLFGRFLTDEEMPLVSGGICIITSTVSGQPLATDDEKHQGPSCESEEAPPAV